MEGYFKLYRKILSSPVFANPKALKVFIWCLAKATYKDFETLVGLQVVKLQPRSIYFWER